MANDFTLSTSGDGTLNANTSKSFNAFVSQGTTDTSITYQAKFVVASGSKGAGTITQNGANVAYGTFGNIAVGNTAYSFEGTSPGTVNIEVTVKDSNGITKTSTVALEVATINYIFSGSAQANTIYVNGTTPINFDITETAASDTSYEMKYSFVEGDGTIKNGSITESANTWYPVSIGGYNRSFVGTNIGSSKITFTVRNKTTLVEKTQNITINVKASEFTFGATRTVTGQVVSSPVPIVLNLTQTGGTGDTYSMTFTSSANGTFIYDGVTYAAGESIPIKIGSSTGEYVGSVVGNHTITFNAKNQLNLSKTSEVTLNYIVNDFTLSSTGDGTMFINQSKDLNAFISQLLPDTSITYQVKFSLDSSTNAGGELTKGGTAVSLGTYQAISTGSTTYNFKGTRAGIVDLLIEVKNNKGLLKRTTVMFEIKSTEFTFIGGAVNNTCYTDDSTLLNFDLSEAITSGTDYEFSYNVSQGNSTVSDGSATLYPYQWYPVSIGNFKRTLSVSSQGSNNLVFTVRNKVTLQTKTVSINVNAYQQPKPINVYTRLDWFDRGGRNKDEWNWYLYCNFIKDPTATIVSAKLELPGYEGGTYNLDINNISTGYGAWFKFAADDSGNPRGYFHFAAYTLTITDSNGVVYVYEGIWINN